MLKASNGGGGRGMRIVHTAEDMPKEYAEARDESKKAFGDDQIFIEKYLKSPKHIEVQIIGDNYGNVVHLYDRDCSVQRRHQKVVEYAPAFSIPEETRQVIFDSSLRLARVPCGRRQQSLLHRDESEDPGRTHGDRNGDRDRYCTDTDPRCSGVYP